MRGLAAGLADRGHDVTLRGIRPAAERTARIVRPAVRDRLHVPTTRCRPRAAARGRRSPRALTRPRPCGTSERVLARYRDGILVCAQVCGHGARRRARHRRVMARGHPHHRAVPLLLSTGAATTEDLRRLIRDLPPASTSSCCSPQADAAAASAGALQQHRVDAEPPPDLPGRRRQRARQPGRRRRPLRREQAARPRPAAPGPRSHTGLPGWRFELYGDGPASGPCSSGLDELGIARLVPR